MVKRRPARGEKKQHDAVRLRHRVATARSRGRRQATYSAGGKKTCRVSSAVPGRNTGNCYLLFAVFEFRRQTHAVDTQIQVGGGKRRFWACKQCVSGERGQGLNRAVNLRTTIQAVGVRGRNTTQKEPQISRSRNFVYFKEAGIFRSKMADRLVTPTRLCR